MKPSNIFLWCLCAVLFLHGVVLLLVYLQSPSPSVCAVSCVDLGYSFSNGAVALDSCVCGDGSGFSVSYSLALIANQSLYVVEST